MPDLDENKIQNVLGNSLIDKGHRMVVPNTEAIHYEADLVSVTKSGYANEYEIKCTRNDFRSEMRAFECSGSSAHTKRMKHRIQKNIWSGDEDWNKSQSPNKFWLVCPAGMVNEDEIPEYWGLYFVADSEVFKVKKAKKIHGEKISTDLALELGRYITSRYWRDY